MPLILTEVSPKIRIPFSPVQLRLRKLLLRLLPVSCPPWHNGSDGHRFRLALPVLPCEHACINFRLEKVSRRDILLLPRLMLPFSTMIMRKRASLLAPREFFKRLQSSAVSMWQLVICTFRQNQGQYRHGRQMQIGGFGTCGTIIIQEMASLQYSPGIRMQFCIGPQYKHSGTVYSPGKDTCPPPCAPRHQWQTK